MEMNGQLDGSAALPPGERAPATHWIEGWVGPRAVLGFVEWRETSASAGSRTPALQPVARHYTD
jgi:hypothetical protein